MERRLLAVVAATAVSVAALTAAVGATTHIFAAGDVAAGVGTISPVSVPTLPPIVEHRVIDVEDPAPGAAPATPVPVADPGPPTPRPTAYTAPGRTVPTAPTVAGTGAVTGPAAAPAPAPAERSASYEPGDD